MTHLKNFIFAVRESGWLAAIFLGLRVILRIRYHRTAALHEMRKFLKWEITPELLERNAAYRKANLPTKRKPDSIHWILPPGNSGSGGHQTAVRMISHLSQRGYQVTVWVTAQEIRSPEQTPEQFRHAFNLKNCTVRLLENPDDIEADVLVATDRGTVFPAALAERVLQKFYFVQDYESLFYEAGSVSVLTDYTYQLGFHPITAGVWLKHFLKMHHGVNGDSFDLACDHAIYNCTKRAEPDQKTVVFYARDSTPRRCVELGLLALERLKKQVPGVHIILFGIGKGGGKLPFAAETHGIISPAEIAQLYQRSTVGLSLSATNHSLIPNEMMACGLPVVELGLPNNQAIYPKDTVTFAPPYPEQISQTLKLLLSNDKLRQKRATKSLRHAQSLSWEKSAKRVEQIILKRFGTI